MSIQRALALTLAVSLATGSLSSATTAAPQGNGAIGGKATDEAKKPYSNYSVQLRDVATGQVASALPLDPEGKFAFNSLALAKKYLVELFDTKQNKVVCTEGPYELSTKLPAKTDVNINCGTNPAAWWLAAAGAAAAAVALGVRSNGS
jgi:hypothetical protein